MGIHLQGLAMNTDTHGQYRRVGEVYGFPVSIISERDVVDGRESVRNRFVVEGNYKYKYNNGNIAMSDTHAACMNFVNALEKIPEIVGQYEKCNARLKEDLPVLQGMADKQWGKEETLKQLKTDLAQLERKIADSLAPSKEKQDAIKAIIKEENISVSRNINTDKWEITVKLGESGKLPVKEIDYVDQVALRNGKSTKLDLVCKYLADDVISMASSMDKSKLNHGVRKHGMSV